MRINEVELYGYNQLTKYDMRAVFATSGDNIDVVTSGARTEMEQYVPYDPYIYMIVDNNDDSVYIYFNTIPLLFTIPPQNVTSFSITFL
jgi:hypothetical protein